MSPQTTYFLEVWSSPTLEGTGDTRMALAEGVHQGYVFRACILFQVSSRPASSLAFFFDSQSLPPLIHTHRWTLTPPPQTIMHMTSHQALNPLEPRTQTNPSSMECSLSSIWPCNDATLLWKCIAFFSLHIWFFFVQRSKQNKEGIMFICQWLVIINKLVKIWLFRSMPFMNYLGSRVRDFLTIFF